jgi:putative oxidoreductase
MFLMSAFNKIMNPAGTQQYMAAMGMSSLTTIFYAGAILLEIIGGLSLLLGYHASLDAWLLVLFTLPATLIFHTNFSDPNQMIHFMKSISVLGGLLYVAAYGAGMVSFDARQTGDLSEPEQPQVAMRKAM